MLEKILFGAVAIKPEEEIIKIVRSSPWSRFWAIALAVLFIFLPFFLIYPLFKQGVWGVVVFAVVLILGAALALRVYLAHFFTVFILTSRRFVAVDQKGFFGRAVHEGLYDTIGEVSQHSRGPLYALLRLGDVYIYFGADRKTRLKLTAVKHPEIVAREILSEQDQSRQVKPNVDADAAKLLQKIKNKLGETKFNELISD